MIKRTLFIFLASLGLLACGPELSPEQMQQLSKLEARLDSAEQHLNQLDSAESFKAIETYEANLHFIQNDLRDTFPRETAFFVDTYYKLRKPLRKYAQFYPAVQQELQINQQQLKDLRRDANNGLIEKEQFDDYLALEQENVEKVENAVQEVMEKSVKAMELFQEKNPRIDSLVKAYKAKQADSL